VRLLEQMPLHLAAGGLRDALDRDHLRNLEAGVLIDQTADRGRRGQEIRDLAPVQHEDHQLLSLGSGLGDTGCNHLVEIQSRGSLGDVFQIVGIVVLAVDENDLLAAAGDVQLALVQDAEIAGVDPAVGIDGLRRSLRIVDVAAGDARAAD
jgi:hypothetical protein